MNIGHELANYAAELEKYIQSQSLPLEWFDEPDHIAIKAANAAHFDALVKQIRKGSLGVEVQDMIRADVDERRIALAFLAGSLAVGAEWQFRLVQIMGPQPDKAGKDKAGIDHMEFYQPLIKPIEQRLLKTGLIPSVDSRLGHNTLSIMFGQAKNELKFTDNPLAEVPQEEQPSGKLHAL